MNRYLVLVTTKEFNVVLDPFQSESLVTKASILRTFLLQSFRLRESKHSEPVIHLHVDHRVAIGYRLNDQPSRLGRWRILTTTCEATPSTLHQQGAVSTIGFDGDLP